MVNFEFALTQLLPAITSVVEARAIGGGCISDAQRVVVSDESGRKRTLFVKSNDASFLDNFEAERDGLRRLAEPGTIAVPEPIAAGVVKNRAWLVMEWIEPGPRTESFFEIFGRQLAQLHQATTGSQIGLPADNFLGAARQINAQRDTWDQFVAVNRIGFQVRWAVDQGLADTSLRSDCERIAATMHDLLDGRDNRTSLLHGDLWSGNFLCDANGNPVIIDPAVYYGCREAEFGMLRLFGSCPDRFYDAYLECFPMAAGWQRRTNIHILYHLLNHLNLFGRSYHEQCRSVAAKILR